VPPDYDPLIAKLMVVDETRDAAITRLARALDETTITGIQTTLPFHRFIARDPRFRAAQLSVDWVDGHWDAIATGRRAAALAVAAEVAAALVAADPPPGATVAPQATGPVASPDVAGSGRRSSGWARAARSAAVDRWPR
jgi:acetyl/propionyl-CoA carboxylase alpha subunit